MFLKIYLSNTFLSVSMKKVKWAEKWKATTGGRKIWVDRAGSLKTVKVCWFKRVVIIKFYTRTHTHTNPQTTIKCASVSPKHTHTHTYLQTMYTPLKFNFYEHNMFQWQHTHSDKEALHTQTHRDTPSFKVSFCLCLCLSLNFTAHHPLPPTTIILATAFYVCRTLLNEFKRGKLPACHAHRPLLSITLAI